MIAVFQIMAKPHTNCNIISDCCFHTNKYVFSNLRKSLRDLSGGHYFKTLFHNHTLSTYSTILWWDKSISVTKKLSSSSFRMIAVFQIMAKPHTNCNIISDCCFHTNKYVFSNLRKSLRDLSGGHYFKTLFHNHTLSTYSTILWWDNEPRSSSVYIRILIDKSVRFYYWEYTNAFLQELLCKGLSDI